jgi:integrase
MGDDRKALKGVELRPNSIRLHFTWEGKGHKRTLRKNGAPLAPSPANIRFAERLAAEIRERIRFGTFSLAEYFPADEEATSGAALTFGNQLDTWLEAQRIEHSTRAGYSSAIRFWKGALVDGMPVGERPLRALRHSDLLRALATKAKLSGKTVNNYVSVAREALALAVADRVLSENPAEAIPRAAHQKEPPDPFSREEAERVIAHLAAKAPAPVWNMVEFWFWTGLRTSEVAGLRWGSVDLTAGSIVVAEALVRGAAKSRTKTNVARTVLLNSRAQAALRRQKEHTYLAGEHVFLDERYGTPWTEERAFRRSYWEPALKRLEIRYRRPYNMRHSYATQMLMAGMNPAFCARQLGHSVEVFLSTYATWIDGARNDAEMTRLEAAISPEVPRLAGGGKTHL